jgi:flavorubredoxin
LKSVGRCCIKTLVVYDLLYGNTKTIAQAIGGAIPGEVAVRHVAQVQAGDVASADLLIVGSPTHGALPTRAVQNLLERIGSPAREDVQAATFDTRLTWGFLERWGGFAAPKMAATLREKGWTVTGAPSGFFVRGLKKGPLRHGEAERAVARAKGLLGNDE